MQRIQSVTTFEPARKNGLWGQVQHSWLLLLRFSRRYGVAVLALFISAVLGWTIASSVSNYTKGGWEIHFIERGLGLNIHFHHWYYGIPLGLIAFAIMDWNTTLSIFLFGLGQTLAAHSFINEHGIPSIIEGGPTLAVPPEIYFPLVTAFSMLYAFFVIRREEWLVRAREREEIAMSYLCPKPQMDQILGNLAGWAARYFTHKKTHLDKDSGIEYGRWHALDKSARGEWQFQYEASPFDERLNLLVVRLDHIPLQGRAGQMDEMIQEIDAALSPLAQPAVGGPDAALAALAAQNAVEQRILKNTCMA
ncbi:MAG: hypothetical protein M1570_10130 [Chloroflexi bacterium]|nr:hypothetical protein [Chloroflexota bacterium]